METNIEPAIAGAARTGRHWTFVVGAVAAMLVAAACGGDDSTASGASDSGSGSGGRVTTEQVDGLGAVLADADGMTLYTNDAESDGTINCVDGCVDFWPPLEGKAPPGDVSGVGGTFGDVRRPDGTRQVTLDGVPLYTFAKDGAPGSARGDGFEDDFAGDHFVWHAVTTSSDGSSPPSSDGSSSDSGDSGGGIYGDY